MTHVSYKVIRSKKITSLRGHSFIVFVGRLLNRSVFVVVVVVVVFVVVVVVVVLLLWLLLIIVIIYYYHHI